MSAARRHIVVVGGGVIGLSTAIALLDHPSSRYDVTVVAEDLPDHPSTTPLSQSPSPSKPPASYASAWAGAHHVSDAKTEEELARDQVTFDVLKRLHAARPSGFGEAGEPIVWNHQVEYFEQARVNRAAVEWYSDYRELDPSMLPPGARFGCSFSTCTIVVPLYLPFLFRLFLARGGRALHARVTGLEQALSLAESRTADFICNDTTASFAAPSAVVVAPGLGARALANDEAVHPVRGQTLLVRAPWCTLSERDTVPNAGLPRTATVSPWPGLSRCNEEGFRDVYVIPRGGADGHFIVGGTRLPHDWSDEPREATTRDILAQALRYMPALANPHRSLTTGAGEAQPDDVDVVAVNVGFRPARSGGVRLERGPSLGQAEVVYNYGFGGVGYQASWGAALQCRDLVDDALGQARAPRGSTLASLDGRCQL